MNEDSFLWSPPPSQMQAARNDEKVERARVSELDVFLPSSTNQKEDSETYASPGCEIERLKEELRKKEMEMKKIENDKDKLEAYTKRTLAKFQDKYLPALQECIAKLKEKQDKIEALESRGASEKSAQKRNERLLSSTIYELGLAIMKDQLLKERTGNNEIGMLKKEIAKEKLEEERVLKEYADMEKKLLEIRAQHSEALEKLKLAQAKIDYLEAGKKKDSSKIWTAVPFEDGYKAQFGETQKDIDSLERHCSVLPGRRGTTMRKLVRRTMFGPVVGTYRALFSSRGYSGGSSAPSYEEQEFGRQSDGIFILS